MRRERPRLRGEAPRAQLVFERRRERGQPRPRRVVHADPDDPRRLRRRERARATEHEPASRIAAERAIATSADRIVVASAHEKHLLTALYGADAEHIAIVPCGVDLDLFAPMEKEFARRHLGLKDGERVILFVGRIEPLKGIDILISVAAQLHEDENFIVLIVGGDARASAEIEQLRAQAERLGVEIRYDTAAAQALAARRLRVRARDSTGSLRPV